MTQNSQFAAFLSYARADDRHDGGQITRMRRGLQGEVEMLLGLKFPFFQDRDDILVGQQWRERLNGSIDTTSLLVAIVTPSLLASDFCRSEIERFLLRERELDRKDLIVPILYAPTPGLDDQTDDIAVELQSRQHEDWTTLRFEDEGGGEVRRALHRVATQMLVTLRSGDQVARPDSQSLIDLSNDGPGWLEVQVEAERAMERLRVTLTAFSEMMNKVGEIATNATDKLATAGSKSNASATALVVTRSLANALGGPANDMEETAAEYVDLISTLGAGIRLQVERIESGHIAVDESVASYGRSLDQMAAASSQSFGQLASFSQTLKGLYGIDTSLRRVLKRIVVATEHLTATGPEIEEWSTTFRAAVEGRAQ